MRFLSLSRSRIDACNGVCVGAIQRASSWSGSSKRSGFGSAAPLWRLASALTVLVISCELAEKSCGAVPGRLFSRDSDAFEFVSSAALVSLRVAWSTLRASSVATLVCFNCHCTERAHGAWARDQVRRAVCAFFRAVRPGNEFMRTSSGFGIRVLAARPHQNRAFVSY